MLPFLKPEKMRGMVVAQVGPKGEMKEEPQEPDYAMEAVAEDLIRAVHAKDARAVVMALEAAFAIQEVRPHEEYEHEDE